MISWKDNLVFVDTESNGVSPVRGRMTEFGCVHFTTRETFHGRIFDGRPDPENPAIPIVGRRLATDLQVANELLEWMRGIHHPVFVSDNIAWDFMWMAGMFDTAMMENPFGHSGRRISDFWAGLQGDWRKSLTWKKFRQTPHDHNPVNDAMGNVEAFAHILELIEEHEREEAAQRWLRG